MIIVSFCVLQYNFIGWTGDIETNENPTTITMNDHHNITATFVQQFTVNLTEPTEGVVSCSLYPDLPSYNINQAVEVECELENNFQFVQWTNDLEGITENPYTFNVISDMDIAANVIELHTLTICESLANGSILIDPMEEVYIEGTEITITATPDECYDFEGWAPDEFGTSNNYTFNIDDSIEICADFCFNRLSIKEVVDVKIDDRGEKIHSKKIIIGVILLLKLTAFCFA